MNETQFLKYLKDFTVTDYIVTYCMIDDDSHLHYENELLLVDENMNYYWLNDWDEGQVYNIIGFIPVGCVISMTIKDNDKQKLIFAQNAIWEEIHRSREIGE